MFESQSSGAHLYCASHVALFHFNTHVFSAHEYHDKRHCREPLSCIGNESHPNKQDILGTTSIFFHSHYLNDVLTSRCCSQSTALPQTRVCVYDWLKTRESRSKRKRTFVCTCVETTRAPILVNFIRSVRRKGKCQINSSNLAALGNRRDRVCSSYSMSYEKR